MLKSISRIANGACSISGVAVGAGVGTGVAVGNDVGVGLSVGLGVGVGRAITSSPKSAARVCSPTLPSIFYSLCAR